MQELKITDRFLPSWAIFPFTILLLGVFYFFYSLEMESNVKRNALFVVLGVFYLAGLLLLTMKLEIVLSPTAIAYQFSFFGTQNNYTVLEKANIRQLSVRSVNALREFGGLGIRYNKGAKAYLAGGNYAIELLYNNQKLLLGISDKTEAEGFLKAHHWN